MGARILAGAGALGYLIGMLPSADIAAGLAGRRQGRSIDLRREGSGNPGGTNARNVLGRRYGYAVMAADIGKGAAASALGRMIAGGPGAHLAGTASVIGHCLPVYNGFRGGKGVGASVGQVLATFPAYFPVDVGVAALTAANPRWKQRSFAATLAASATWVFGSVIWWRKRWPNLWGPAAGPGHVIAALVSSAVIAYKFATATPPTTSALSPGAEPAAAPTVPATAMVPVTETAAMGVGEVVR
jgi:acyl phosphate:glycerol-3-phosphate acyltransferase